MSEDQSESGLPESLKGQLKGPAAEIMARADRDMIFVIKLLSDSQYILQRHFQDFVQAELTKRDVTFGDHPLLLPFIEMHGRELAEFVVTGVGVQHQIRLDGFENMTGDPGRELRHEISDTLQSHIEKAEAHFVSDIGGLQQILHAVQDARHLRVDLDD